MDVSDAQSKSATSFAVIDIVSCSMAFRSSVSFIPALPALLAPLRGAPLTIVRVLTHRPAIISSADAQSVLPVGSDGSKAPGEAPVIDCESCPAYDAIKRKR